MKQALSIHLQVLAASWLVLSCAVALGFGSASSAKASDDSLALSWPPSASVKIGTSIGSVRVYRTPDCGQCSQMIGHIQNDRANNPLQKCVILFDQPLDPEVNKMASYDKGIVLADRAKCAPAWRNVFPGRYLYSFQSGTLTEVRK